MRRSCAVVLLLIGVAIPRADAQSFEAGAHMAVSQWSEFEGNDFGLGGRFTWKPSPLLGVEADLTWYPSDFPSELAFSGNRLEGLLGFTVGRSEERRVGKECRSRWSLYHEKKQTR